ncbi:MAG: hypothetical protein ACTHZ5_03100 [Micrococcaceae bacterium]
MSTRTKKRNRFVSAAAAIVVAGALMLSTGAPASADNMREHWYGKNYVSCLVQSNVQHTKFARQFHNAYISKNCFKLKSGSDWHYATQFRFGSPK